MTTLLVAPLQQTAPFAVELYGHGQVGQALLARLQEEDVPVAAVYNSKGLVARHDAGRLPRVLVDATTPRYAGPPAEAWIQKLEQTLIAGVPIVTCNKPPLALAWTRLQEAARRGRTTILISGTVGAGTPILPTLARLSRSVGLARVEACLSGTLSFVLDQLRHGEGFEAAVRAAQAAGYAEPDPTLDLDGTDAYAKAVILHNRLFPHVPARTLHDRDAFELGDAEVRRLVEAGLVPQAIATIAPGRIQLRLEGRTPETALPANANLVAVRATGRDGSTFTLTGPGAGPAITASALLGDLQALADPRSVTC